MLVRGCELSAPPPGAWRGGHKYQRAYDGAYQELRRRLLATITPETRCAVCGRPAIQGDHWQTPYYAAESSG